MRVFVLLGYAFDQDQARALHARGETPEPSFYGFHHAQGMVQQLQHSTGLGRNRFWRAWRVLAIRLLGFDLMQAWRNRHGILAADVVWTMSEREGLAVAALLRLLRPVRRPQLICQCIWLFDELPRLGRLRRWLTEALLAHCDAITVHSRRLLPQVPAPHAGRSVFMPFGVGGCFLRPLVAQPPCDDAGRAERGLRLVCAGRDASRDWDIVARVARRLPRHHFEIFCLWAEPARFANLPNVQVHRRAGHAALLAACLSADALLVPMHENLYSGITVALEAAAMGVPCIAARTGGVDSYFDDSELFFYAPQDAADLARQITALAQSPALGWRKCRAAQARFQRDGLSTRGLMARYVALSRQLLARTSERCVAGGVAATRSS